MLCEAVELFDLANRIDSINPVICEIGSWKGKSAYVFASALKDKEGILFALILYRRRRWRVGRNV